MIFPLSPPRIRNQRSVSDCCGELVIQYEVFGNGLIKMGSRNNALAQISTLIAGQAFIQGKHDRLLAHRLEVRTGPSFTHVRQADDIDIGIQRHLFQIDIKDLYPLVLCRHGKFKDVVKTSRPEHSGLNQVNTVRRSYDQDTQ